MLEAIDLTWEVECASQLSQLSWQSPGSALSLNHGLNGGTENIERQVSPKALESSFAVFKLLSCFSSSSSASSR